MSFVLAFEVGRLHEGGDGLVSLLRKIQIQDSDLLFGCFLVGEFSIELEEESEALVPFGEEVEEDG